jgi:hypothetical protein
MYQLDTCLLSLNFRCMSFCYNNDINVVMNESTKCTTFHRLGNATSIRVIPFFALNPFGIWQFQHTAYTVNGNIFDSFHFGINAPSFSDWKHRHPSSFETVYKMTSHYFLGSGQHSSSLTFASGFSKIH